jgi:hypothetical protein
MEHARPVIIIESNLAFEATHTFYDMQRAGVSSWLFMREDSGNIGVRTDNRLKTSMALALSTKLSERTVYWHAAFVHVGIGRDGTRKPDATERIKRELCDQATAAMVTAAIKGGRARPRAAAPPPPVDPGWLRTVRPWWGHHDHLHVRLKCPADSAGCESQPPLAAGDGCNEIAWWEAEEARRAQARREPPPPPIEPPPPPPLPPLPAACQALLESPSGLRATAQRPR